MSFQANTAHTELLWYPLFVYGTLRHGQENYTLLRGYTLSEVAARVEGHTLYSLNSYPVAVPGTGIVMGELLTFSPNVYTDVLDQLDGFEHDGRLHRGILRRQTCRAQTATGVVTAWIYRAESVELPETARIESGDWVMHQLQRIVATRLHRYIHPVLKKGL